MKRKQHKHSNLNKIMASLDKLTEDVARNTDVTQSAVVLLQGLKAQLDAAGTDPAKLQLLSNQLGQSDYALAAAILANTPTPTPAPTPVPTIVPTPAP